VAKATGFVLVVSGLAVGTYGLLGKSAYVQDFVKPSSGAANAVVRTQAMGPGTEPAAASSEATPAPVVVTITPGANASGLATKTMAIPKDQDTLARELQRELKRVGCYHGEVHGGWTSATRRAAKDFVDRVNAILPTVQPDPILYVMVKSKSEQVCGAACPMGQHFNQDGRCLPAAILAKSKSKMVSATAAPSGKINPSDPPSIIARSSPASDPRPGAPSLTSGLADEHMSLAGPIPAEASKTAAAPRPRVVHSTTRLPVGTPGATSWSRTVFAANRSPN
jgi:hypothetical protein